jgi:hypothetical protein
LRKNAAIAQLRKKVCCNRSVEEKTLLQSLSCGKNFVAIAQLRKKLRSNRSVEGKNSAAIVQLRKKLRSNRSVEEKPRRTRSVEE